MGEETGSESDDDDDDDDEGDSDSDDDEDDTTLGDYVPDESGTDDEETIARDEKAEMQEDAVAKAGLRIRIHDQKLKKKITAEKKLNFFWIKNYNLPIPRPP